MEISKTTETKHFGKQKISRLKNDASHTGLGAVLEQQYTESWFPIAHASRFLNGAELKYSTNELELLSLVWATDHFKYYLLGSIFDLSLTIQPNFPLPNPNGPTNTAEADYPVG